MYDRTDYARMMSAAHLLESGRIEQAALAHARHFPKPKPVKVRVLVPIVVAGKPAKVGDEVVLDDCEADGQVALKRVERV